MTTAFLGGKKDADHDSVTVVLEHQDGALQVLEDCELTVGVIIHEESRQAFPEPTPIAQYLLSLDNDFSELDNEITYFDDELPAPVEAPEFVFGAAVAACEAAERGELGDPEEVKAHSRLQFIAGMGGVVFLLSMAVGGLMVRGGVAMPFGGG